MQKCIVFATPLLRSSTFYITSSVYRAGVSMAKKWTAYFNKYLCHSLPVTVISAYQSGKLETDDMQMSAQSKAIASPKRSKRPDAASSGVILTKEQVQTLERVYFSSTADLTDSLCSSRHSSRILSQWFEKVEDLRKFKLLHGTAVVTTAQDDRLYQWAVRQRKRFHLTLHHNPQFQSERYTELLSADSSTDRDEDVAWLMKKPSMSGTFALSPPRRKKRAPSGLPASKASDEDIQTSAEDMKISKAIQDLHQQTLYYPQNSSPPYRHSSSLFWDESLEALRFFRGDNKHTLVPRSYPYDEKLR